MLALNFLIKFPVVYAELSTPVFEPNSDWISDVFIGDRALSASYVVNSMFGICKSFKVLSTAWDW